MSSKHVAQAYALIGLETGVAAADPHRLIVMLYDGALAALAEADGHLAARRVADQGAQISKAISIIDDGLRASVDPERGGELARQLLDLYDYMNRRLLLANVRNDRTVLAEVARLLADLRGAWVDIATRPPVATSLLGQAAA